MKIVVFGATGRIGRRLMAGGVARGHEMTGAARRPERSPALASTARLIRCDMLDAAQVDAAVTGQDTVVAAVGARMVLAPGVVHSQGIANVIAGMRAHAVHRLVCLSAAGTHDDADPNLPWLFTHLLRPVLFARVWDELRAMEAQVTGSGLDWTIVHLAHLTDGEALGSYRTEAGDSLPGGHSISRADVADFVLKELARGEWVGRDVAVAY